MDRARMRRRVEPTPVPAREVAVHLAGEQMVLRGDRTVYWPGRNWLLLADLHVGKTESLRRDGVALPDGVLASDLARLTLAVRATGAERVLVLGDLVHDAHGLTARVVAQVAAWRSEIPAEVALVPGNHDQRVTALPTEWRVRVLEALVREGPFTFVHDAESGVRASSAGFTWHGHVHPVMALRGATDSMRLPCYVMRSTVGIVPAFSTLTGGTTISASVGDRAWVVADGQLLELPLR
jgi:uncharacterized protein